jgi:hypothetical protein
MIRPAKTPASVQSLTLEDYIRAMEASGIFNANAAAPENDPRVLRAFLKLCRDAYPGEEEPLVDLYAGYGFFRDTIDFERTGKSWAFATPVIDSCIGVSADQFMIDLPAIRNEAAQNGDVILTDTFSFIDGYGSNAPSANIICMNSPVAAISSSFADYLDSLTSDRRKKYRRMVQDFETAPLEFHLDNNPLSSSELDWVRSQLEKKWGDEAGYAFRQTLWASAAQSYRPQQSLVMRVTEGGHLVFMQTMIIKNKTVYCQSIVKDENRFYSGLAAFTDFKCVEALCGKRGYEYFDPSCRTSLDDPESIGVAKRATVNHNVIKPLLAIGADLPSDIHACVQGKEA